MPTARHPSNAQLRGLLAGYIGRPVVHCSDAELSALGVAHLAGLGAGVWDWGALRALPRTQQETTATQTPEASAHARQRWAQAVARSRLAEAGRG